MNVPLATASHAPTGMPPAGHTAWTLPERLNFTAGLGLVAGILAACIHYRAGRLISFDGYHYCEFAKIYTSTWPTAFGNHWPCGYPLLGGLLGRLGLPAYEALTLVSIVSLAGLLFLSARLLAGVPFNRGLVVALAVMPIVSMQLLGVLTELPFAFAWLALVVALADWERPAAWWWAGAAAVAGLALRYAGGLGLIVLWAWLLLKARPLQGRSALANAAAATVATTLLSIGLLYWNWKATGHFSGAPRAAEGNPSLMTWLHQVADIGWSPVGALGLGGVRHWTGEGLVTLIIGGIVTLGILGICLSGWHTPRRPWAPALALGLLVYWFGMTILRTVGGFDPLFNARTTMPAVFPITILAVIQLPSPRRQRAFAGTLVVGLLLIAAGSLLRGGSREIAGDIRAALPPLRARIGPLDQIGINDHALTLTGYLRNRVVRVWPVRETGISNQRFLVIAGRPRNRSGAPETVSSEWRNFAADLVDQGRYGWLLDTPALLVLERTSTAVGR